MVQRSQHLPGGEFGRRRLGVARAPRRGDHRGPRGRRRRLLRAVARDAVSASGSPVDVVLRPHDPRGALRRHGGANLPGVVAGIRDQIHGSAQREDASSALHLGRRSPAEQLEVGSLLLALRRRPRSHHLEVLGLEEPGPEVSFGDLPGEDVVDEGLSHRGPLGEDAVHPLVRQRRGDLVAVARALALYPRDLGVVDARALVGAHLGHRAGEEMPPRRPELVVGDCRAELGAVAAVLGPHDELAVHVGEVAVCGEERLASRALGGGGDVRAVGVRAPVGVLPAVRVRPRSARPHDLGERRLDGVAEGVPVGLGARKR
mmetsp:Transcript_10983/g.45721  ORF Transcript_10983/g.45721 Transcript_10983/m.45721 type:complete len:317 (+) Transcript_10983:5632-6582(+)